MGISVGGPRVRDGSGVKGPRNPGWDISSLNLAEAMRRAQVLDCGLQEQLWPHMESLRPRPSVYIPEFIAANQTARADNLIPGTRAQQVGSSTCSQALCHLLHGHMVSPFGNNTYTPRPKPLDNLDNLYLLFLLPFPVGANPKGH